MGNLESYDTRLWFVVVFIPIIPLGRKRIIDKCPSCTRHYVMKADVYEQSKQLQTSASLERFRREPSADAAVEAHGELLAFHEHQQAADFRQTALGAVPGPRRPPRGHGRAAPRHVRRSTNPPGSSRSALDLDRELPEARVGVAQRKMAEGDLDEAEGLLDFLDGARRRSAILTRTARHPGGLLATRGSTRAGTPDRGSAPAANSPNWQTHHAFRAFVKRSEKALGRTESILPERGFSLSGLFRSEGSPYAPWQRRLAIGSIAAVLLLGGLAINNEYIRRHRTLHVLNATGQAAQVQVDDQPAAR